MRSRSSTGFHLTDIFIFRIVSVLFGFPVALTAITYTVDVLVWHGDPSPDGNGNLEFIQSLPPPLSDSGRVTLHANVGIDFEEALVAFGGGSPAAMISRQGDSAPDGNGQFLFYGPATISGSGLVAFNGQLTGVSGTYDSYGLFRSGPSLVQLVRGDDLGPGGSGSFGYFPGDGFQDPTPVNSSGLIAFLASLEGNANPEDDVLRVWKSDGTTVSEIERLGQTLSGLGIVDEIGNPSLNDSGQVVFFAKTREQGMHIMRDSGTLLESVAGSGQGVPGGGKISEPPFGPFAEHIFPVNTSGTVAFAAILSDTPDTTGEGVYVSSGGVLTEIVRKGDSAPGGGTYFGLLGADSPSLNDKGAVAFKCTIELGGFNFVQGVFTGDGSAAPAEVLREGQAAPDGNGDFGELFTPPAINNSGDVVVFPNVNRPGGGIVDSGLYHFEAATGTLSKVIRTGDLIDGKRIDELAFASTSGLGNIASGFNNAGQIAFFFGLEDGRRGIAIANPPAVVTITITGFNLGAGGAVLNWIVSSLSGVDIYRSADLINWGSPIATNVTTGTYTDTTISPGSAQFYVLVLTGQPFP